MNLTPEAWMARSLCADYPDPDLWFAAPSELVRRKAAISICKNCPVRSECTDFAIRTRVEDGIWGGLDPNQIRRLMRRPA